MHSVHRNLPKGIDQIEVREVLLLSRKVVPSLQEDRHLHTMVTPVGLYEQCNELHNTGFSENEKLSHHEMT